MVEVANHPVEKAMNIELRGVAVRPTRHRLVQIHPLAKSSATKQEAGDVHHGDTDQGPLELGRIQRPGEERGRARDR